MKRIKKCLVMFPITVLIVLIALLYGVRVMAQHTFCNPLNIDYGCGGIIADEPYREAADPVIVLFKDKYYLFATGDHGGYRMSDDLVNWESVQFCEKNPSVETFTKLNHYTAPAVAADDNYMYLIRFNAPGEILRSSDPSTGKWEKCSTIGLPADPHMLIDNGRYFIYHGLGDEAKCYELDPTTMTKINGSEVEVRPFIRDMATCPGYNFGHNELSKELEAGKMKYNFTKTPCTEGTWVVKHGNKYYLSFATPGTSSQWYCDAVMTADNPKGPFKFEPYNPVSLNVGDFAGSAGHSCVFEDKYGNWWQAATMWVGKYTGFERRIGLFPVKFDDEGRMKVYTRFGEFPQIIPQKKFDPDEQYLAGWNLLSLRKKCTASSYFSYINIPENASDEDIRTWWAAKTNNKGEWLQMDLDGVKTIMAIQVNFTEHEAIRVDMPEEDYNAYIIYASEDGNTWNTIIDKSNNRVGNTHDYVQLANPVKARYIKIENVHMAKNNNFAISDLRVFGFGDGDVPEAVTNVRAVRDAKDDRYSTVTWDVVPSADGYVVQFGYQPDFLNQSIMVKDKNKHSLDIHILTSGQPYYYRVDAFNENGVTEGESVVGETTAFIESYTPVVDNYVTNADVDGAYGADEHFDEIQVWSSVSFDDKVNDIVGLMSFDLPEHSGEITKATLVLHAKMTKGDRKLNIYPFDYAISDNDTWKTQEANINEAREGKTLAEGVVLNGMPGCSATEIPAENKVYNKTDAWKTEFDITEYVKSIKKGNIGLLLTHDAGNSTSFDSSGVKLYSNGVKDIKLKDNTIFDAFYLKPRLNVEYITASNIDNVEVLESGRNAPKGIYTLAGMCVANADRPGIYIIDGKKVLVR